MPYSVSMPQIFGIATVAAYRSPTVTLAGAAGAATGTGRWRPARWHGRPRRSVVVLRDERADVDDPLALLARDLRPVVGVGGVGQVLVLLVLLVDRLDEVVDADAPVAAGDEALDGQLLGPAHDVLDHGPDEKSLKYMISLSPFW